MQYLDLDSDGATGTLTGVGERLALDFVNTRTWPGDPKEHEWFDRPANVTRWALASGIVSEADAQRLKCGAVSNPDAANTSLARIRELRSVVEHVFRPLSEGHEPAVRNVEALNQLVAAVMPYRSVDAKTRQWRWPAPEMLEDLFRPVLLDAAEFLVEVDLDSLRVCPPCRFLFYDRSRNHQRRWCDMSLCGGREKARRYYQRKTAAE